MVASSLLFLSAPLPWGAVGCPVSGDVHAALWMSPHPEELWPPPARAEPLDGTAALNTILLPPHEGP